MNKTEVSLESKVLTLQWRPRPQFLFVLPFFLSIKNETFQIAK